MCNFNRPTIWFLSFVLRGVQYSCRLKDLQITCSRQHVKFIFERVKFDSSSYNIYYSYLARTVINWWFLMLEEKEQTDWSTLWVCVHIYFCERINTIIIRNAVASLYFNFHFFCILRRGFCTTSIGQQSKFKVLAIHWYCGGRN